MRRPRHLISKLLLVLLIGGSGFAAFWFGLVPQRWSPFSPLSLADPKPWFLDFRLAAIRRDPALCAAVLAAPHIDARPIVDLSRRDGCGWRNAVRVSEVAGAELPIGQITCEMAAALALWLEHDVQPLAQAVLGARVTRVEQMGSYACRNIIGSKAWRNVRSQHATANALDIAGFQLSDGRRISLLRHWTAAGPEGEFLRQAHRRSCRYFRVSLSPDFNVAHRDHFHFDRGPLWTCR